MTTFITIVKCQNPKAGFLARKLKAAGIEAIVDNRFGGRVAADIDKADQAFEITGPFLFEPDDNPAFVDEDVAVALATGDITG